MNTRNLFLVPALCLSLAACQAQVAPVKPQHVTIGIQASPAMALVMIAKDKDLFKAEGLDVELKQFTAGKLALQAFLANSLDFAVSGDVPPLLAALQGHSFFIPAQIVTKTTNEVRVVARKDDHADSAKEYFTATKKKIATSIGGGPEFFLYEFLKKLGIPAAGIEIVSQNPGDMPAAIAGGSVDAIAVFDPFAYLAENQLGSASVTFTDKDIYSELYVLEAHNDAQSNPETVEKILKALKAAEIIVETHPDDAKAVVMKYTKLNKSTIDSIWANYDFHIALTPQLLEYWNREVLWAKETGKADKAAATPDFRSLLFTTPLLKIAPDRVQL